MVVHAIRIARTTGCFDEVLVSTDCPEIAAVALRHGASVPFMRSDATSNDYAGTFEVISEVIECLERMGHIWNIGVCIYPTAVLAKAQDIAQAIDWIAKGDASSVLPVAKFDYPIWRSLLLGPDEAPSYAFPEFSNARSQDLPSAYHDAGQWYAFDIGTLRTCGRFMSERTRVIVKPTEHVQDIDTLEDLRVAELKYRARREWEGPLRERQLPWVLIRADASQLIGSGHVMRCLALAEAFAARGHEVIFVSQECVPEMRQVIEARGFESVLLDMPEECEGAGQLADAAGVIAIIDGESTPPSWVVVDHYGLAAEWERSVRSCASPLLAVVDLDDRLHACDALLDQSMIEDHHWKYQELVPEGARLLLGGGYALLRSEFAGACAKRKELLREDSVHDVVIFMGATDAGNLTQQLALNLRDHLEASQLLVVVGHLNPHREGIEMWCQAEGLRCEVGIENMSFVLQTCRLFLGACGMTAVEAQAVGIPCLLITLSHVQQVEARWFAEIQRAVLLEPVQCSDAGMVERALAKALDLAPDSPSMSPISVHGATNVVDALMDMSHE